MHPVGVVTSTDGRVRRLRGSVEWQTAHPQAIIGVPVLVPVPKNVTVNGIATR